MKSSAAKAEPHAGRRPTAPSCGEEGRMEPSGSRAPTSWGGGRTAIWAVQRPRVRVVVEARRSLREDAT